MSERPVALTYRIALGLGVLIAAPAQAATISVSSFSSGYFDQKVAELTNYAEELFPDQVNYASASGAIHTRVGTFERFLDFDDTNMRNLSLDSELGSNFEVSVRSDPVYGRADTTFLRSLPTSSGFLDSGGAPTILWQASAPQTSFSRIIFNLVDASDTGGTLNIRVGDSTYAINGSVARPDRNGEVRTVDIDLGEFVEKADVTFSVIGSGFAPYYFDAFGIDDVFLGTSSAVSPGPQLVAEELAAVPLTQSLFFLLAGFVGLALLRRWNTTT